MPDRPEAPRVHPEDRNEWRSWLLSHHQSETGVWLVTWRKAAGKPILGYDEAVSEGLCVGWVDSLPKKLDELRTMLYFSPRKLAARGLDPTSSGSSGCGRPGS